ncbi:MAG: zinc-binding dehydrogenase [Anaerolineae bacterium]
MSTIDSQGLVLLGNRQAEVRRFPVPDPGPGEVRIRVKAAGICGSDLHFYRSTPEELSIRRGVVIGHEPSGVIESVGPCVEHLHPGDRVTVNHTLGCGHCEYCRAGETVLCTQNLGIAASGYGGDAEVTLMPAGACLRLPDELSYIEGTFIACTGATAFSALRKLSASGRQRLVVFGLGPVGLSAVILGKALGATVYGVDLISERLDFARELGADAIVDAAQTDAVAAVRALTDGRGVELAFETSGSPAGQSDAVDVLRPRGKVAFVGLGKGKKSISPEQFIHKQAVLYGSKVMPVSMYEEMVRFMLRQGVRFEPIVTHRLPLEEGPNAFAAFDAGAAGKFILEM